MTNVTEDRRTDQRIKLYRLTVDLLDAVFELPTWYSIDQWSRDVVSVAVRRCQQAQEAVRNGVGELAEDDNLDEPTRAAHLFAKAVLTDCESDIDFVRSELSSFAN